MLSNLPPRGSKNYDLLGDIDDNHAVIKMTIMDSGSGLSQEEQQQLFKRYSQTSAGRQQTGSGLGLMICKELIKNMLGDLSLESHPGIGTTFTITIPVEITQQVATVEAKAEQPMTLPEKLSILIADDHPTNRLLLKRQLNLLDMMLMKPLMVCKRYTKSVCNIMICLLLTLICRIWMVLS